MKFSIKPSRLIAVLDITKQLDSMKRLVLVSAIVMSGFMVKTANAQIGVRFNINLGHAPVYVAPAPVCNDVDYYYLPDVEAYYSVNQHCYYYQDDDRWVSAAYLPGRYHDYDWAHCSRRFAIRESRPYLHNDVYRARYGGFEGRRDWGYRDERSTRVYVDRDRIDRNQYYNRHNDDRGRFDGRNDYRQQSQYNNDHYNRSNDWGGRDGGQGRRGGF